ncbi:MAG: hypothetical protein NZ700_14985 [Gemmataceae bacterium]|nr:hypothetical protein [Gemmataceae bacterium]MDW8267465.1 hypothetical protein [Gemmataceae bacterium]
MYPLTKEQLRALVAAQQPPCISIYQPTHRQHPANQQDPIRFKNLVRMAEESLRQQYPNRDVRDLLKPLQDLIADSLFWNHTRDGLAVLACPGTLRVFQVQRSLPERAVVADSFHVKPLLRYLQSADRFQVLALTRDTAAVYEGNRYALDAEPLPENFPARLDQVVRPEEREQGVAIGSANSGVGSPKMIWGHGEGKYETDTEKFFRAVDKAVTEEFSKPSGLPLVLAALPEHQGTFRQLTQNPRLWSEGVIGNPTAWTTDQLRQQVWKVFEPFYLSRLEKLKENFTTAQAREAGSGDLADVARAAVAGRVGILLVEDERVVPGILNRQDGSIRPADLQSPRVDDMLDDLAELVLSTGGEVVVVPAERMPTRTGLAAIFRY